MKGKTVHFRINGKEESVSTRSNQKLDFCYGFLRLQCNEKDSEIQVTLFSVVNDEGTNSFVLVGIAN